MALCSGFKRSRPFAERCLRDSLTIQRLFNLLDHGTGVQAPFQKVRDRMSGISRLPDHIGIVTEMNGDIRKQSEDDLRLHY